MSTISESVRGCVLATPLERPRTTHDAVRALLLQVPSESLPEDMSCAAMEAAIRRTLRAMDYFVRVGE